MIPFPFTFFASSSFSPTEVAGLELWIDVTDSSSLTLSGSEIRAVADKSGNSNTATPSGTGPSYATNQINGLSAATFNGTGNNLVTPLVCPTTFTIFVVFNPVDVNSGGRLFGGEDAGNGNAGTGFQVNSGGTMTFIARNASSFGDVEPTGISDGSPSWNVFDASIGPSGTLTFVNGTNSGTNTNIEFIVNGGYSFTIGSASVRNGSTFYDGSWSECLVYSGELDSTDRNNVRDYLLTKYAI